MNIIKKYWDSVYIYVLLLVPGFCMCAGIYWTVCKLLGLYSDLSWIKIMIFDGSHLIYFAVALYFIHQNKKSPSYIAEHLFYIKCFIVFALFVQYNFILYLFASNHVWECTFLFFAIIVFLFDSKLMFFNLLSYFFSLLMAHILKPEAFLPLEAPNLAEIIAYRIVIFVLTAFCILLIVYFVERFLMQAQESDEENVHLLEKQVKYYRDMELLDTELRKFRHDIKNHFICLETLFRNGDIEELQKYFEDLQPSFSSQKKMYFSGNDVVDAILHYDLPHYCKEEVGVTIYGNLPGNHTVSTMDLCTLFSNLLSNAITSANQCVGICDSQIIIQFSSGRTHFSITMSNSILPQKGLKTGKDKDRNHGFGAHKIKDVLDKYNGGFELSTGHQMLTITIYLPL